MDKNTAAVVTLVVVVLVVIAFFAVFRLRGKFKLKGPFGVSAEAQGENAAVRLKNASAGGTIRVQEEGGHGVDAEKLKAKGDIDISSSAKEQPPPKE